MEPKDFARVLLRRKRTVITAIVIVGITALLGSFRKAPAYLAACEVLAQPVGNDASNENSRSIETLGSLETLRQLLTSPIIAGDAARIAQLPIERVQGRLNTEVLKDTAIFQLKTFDGDPKVAGYVCNAYAQAFIDLRRNEALKFFEGARRSIEARQITIAKDLRVIKEDLTHARKVKDTEDEIRLVNARNNLLEEEGELRKSHAKVTTALGEDIDGGGKIIRPSGGGVREGGDHKRDLFVGLLVGLMFGIGIALVREYLDDTVRDKESTQRELGLSVLAALPEEGLDGSFEPSSGTVEAARTLRATLASLGFPHEKQMLVVTSTLSKTRSTTLTSLAGAVAESGRSVLVIGSDLRSARTHEAFGVANTVGLANVVRGQVAMERAIRPAPGLDGVFVLPCGPIIGNPGELLSSEGMAVLLQRARRWADVVLLDAPPVLAAADASVLGAYADGVLLVVSAGQTNRSQANEAKEQLVAAGARVLGAVLVGAEELQAAGLGEELPHLVPYGDSWAPGYDAGYGDWSAEVLTATARMEPRASAPRRAPRKKTAAASPKDRPTTRRDRVAPLPSQKRTTVKGNDARTTRARPSTSSPRARTSTRRASTTRRNASTARRGSASRGRR